MICEQVAQYVKANIGQTDFEWLEKHVESCKECQRILSIVDKLIVDVLEGDAND